MLYSLVLIPAVSAILISGISNVTRVKQIALIATIIEAVLSVYLYLVYDLSISGYQFVSS
jgi:NADH:ubiquinone oxidoreductase subunit 4 (subunit M)